MKEFSYKKTFVCFAVAKNNWRGDSKAGVSRSAFGRLGGIDLSRYRFSVKEQVWKLIEQVKDSLCRTRYIPPVLLQG